jgi:hypothetical protein
MAISEINARAAINFRMTRLHVAEHCPRSPEDGSFDRERVINYAISAFAFLCEFGGNPSFLLISRRIIVETAGQSTRAGAEPCHRDE